MLHRTLAKVTSDIERFHLNTAISAIMELVNGVYATKSGGCRSWYTEILEHLALMLAPSRPIWPKKCGIG